VKRPWIFAVDGVIVAAILIDIVLSGMTWVAPQMWFETLHGATGDQSAFYPFLRRCGAHWAAFAIFQIVALVRWRRGLHWLLLVAGMRMSDLFTDLTYLIESRTLASGSAYAGLILPFFLNLGMAVLLVLAWKEALRAQGLKPPSLEQAPAP